MFSRTKGIAALALALTLPMAACDGGTDTEFGTVSILLTDAPGDNIEKAFVTITDIYLQGQGGDDDPMGGRVYLLEDAEEKHDLLTLAETTAELVVGQEVPTGSYGQLRIVLSGGCIETDDGSIFASSGYGECGTATGTLQMPSMQQSGVKVLLNGLQVDGGQQVLLLDFSVAESFGKVAGASGMWVMTPVIHTSELGLTVGVQATLSAEEGTLPDGFTLGDFSATLDPVNSDSSRVTFTDADEDGTFEVNFQFLVPENDPFEVRLNGPDGLNFTVTPTSPQSVMPASGETAEVDWLIESASAEATAG